QFVPVSVTALSAVHNQAAVVFCGEGKLLDGAKTVLAGLAENRALPPGLASIGGHQQERILLERKQDLTAGPPGLRIQKLKAIDPGPADVLVHPAQAPPRIVTRQ